MSVNDDLQALKKKVQRQAAVVDDNHVSQRPAKFFQATVIYKHLYPKRNFLDQPFYVSLQYVSPEVFMTEVEVTQFMPFFIKRLVDTKVIGADAIMPDLTVNYDLVSCGCAPLSLTQMERNID